MGTRIELEQNGNGTWQWRIMAYQNGLPAKLHGSGGPYVKKEDAWGDCEAWFNAVAELNRSMLSPQMK